MRDLGTAIELTQQESRKRALAEMTAAGRVAFVRIPDDPRGRYCQVFSGVDGDTVSDPIEPPPDRLSAYADSLATFADTARLFGVKAVLVDCDCVVGLVDPLDRRDRVTLRLPYTNEFELLLKWGGRVELQQAQLVRLLRLELASSVVSDSARQLLRFAESFAINTNASQQSTVRRDMESLGKAISNAVKAEAGDCPDAITLSVLIHSDSSLGVRRDVRIAVDFSPSAGQFFLSPSESDIHTAIELQIASAISQLTSAFTDEDRPQIVGASL